MTRNGVQVGHAERRLPQAACTKQPSMEITTNSQPKIRSDLTISRQETGDGEWFIVKDPLAGSFFRIREAEQFILQQLDGRTPLSAVRQRVEEKFDASLTDGTLNAFVRTLDQRGLLEAEKPMKRRKKDSRIVRGNLLYLRFKAVDPSRIFDFLGPRVQFFFTRQFVGLATVLILISAWTLLLNWTPLLRDISSLYRLTTIPLAVVTIFLVILAHECAHGLTCRHFGGEVREVGFLLIYFQPAFYCNVSDAWLFPEKSKRLWVGGAGPFFELFLLAISVLVWRTVDVQTWIGSIALIVIATSSVKTLINLNPMIKLDGYYLLADMLEIPNLRQRSFRYVGGLLKRVAGLNPAPTGELSRRERRIFFVYGVLASAGSFLVLAYVLATAGGYLIEGSRPAIALMSAVLLAAKVRRRLRRLFRNQGGVDSFDDFDDIEGSESALVKTTVAEEVDFRRPSQPVPSPPRHRSHRRRIFIPIRWILALAVVTLVLAVGRLHLKISGPFTVLPAAHADIRAAVDGVVDRVLVREGDAVKAGDPIVQLSDGIPRAELKKVESDVDAKRARLRMLLAGSRPEEIELAKRSVDTSSAKHERTSDLRGEAEKARSERILLADTEIKKAEERLVFAQRNSDMFNQLVARGLGARSQQDAADEQLALRKRELDEAKSQKAVLLAENLADVRRDEAVAEKEAKEAEGRLSLLVAGTRREEIEALEADIRRSEADRALLTEQIRGTQVLSPASGVIVTPSLVLKELDGQAVKKGDILAKVYDFRAVTALIDISEKEIADVRIGQQVELRARAHPALAFHGTVTSIASTAEGVSRSLISSASTSTPPGSDKTVVVSTEIDNQDLLLKPEMTGQAKVLCGSMPIFNLVSRRIARTFRVEVWSWW
jgi:putative peptide zinc metalloprotease protein